SSVCGRGRTYPSLCTSGSNQTDIFAAAIAPDFARSQRRLAGFCEARQAPPSNSTFKFSSTCGVASDVTPHMAYGNQKVNRNDRCITRAFRAVFTCPNAVLTCCLKVVEVGSSSNRAVVLTPENWVWLKTLYISHRNCR